MEKIINLTNFPATKEQEEQGVINCPEIDMVKKLLNFQHQPAPEEIRKRAILIADIAAKYECNNAMISGALYLMRPLQEELLNRGINAKFAFSERQSVDKPQPDGSVKKENVFVHKGFISPDSTFSIPLEPNANILNLTQHKATPDQMASGVIEPKDKSEIQKYLTFDSIESERAIRRRAMALADIALENNCRIAMIGGAPYLMAALEDELNKVGIKPVYAYSERNVVSETLEDGSTKNNVIFEHKGFIETDIKSKSKELNVPNIGESI